MFDEYFIGFICFIGGIILDDIVVDVVVWYWLVYLDWLDECVYCEFEVGGEY